MLNNCNLSTFTTLSLAALLCSGLAHAGPGLKALAEAQQKEYSQVKALGSKATIPAIAKIHDDVYGPARKIYLQEKDTQQKSFIQKFKKAFSGTKEQIAALWGLDPKTGLPPQRKPGEAPPKAASSGAAAPVRSKGNTPGGPSPTTGKVEGDAPESMGFKNDEEKKNGPKVIDGIIQDQ